MAEFLKLWKISGLRKNLRLSVLGVLAFVLLLAACRPSRENPPSILDRNGTITAIQAMRVLSATPPTPVPLVDLPAAPTPTRIMVAVASPTGTPFIDRTAFVRQTVKAGPWKTSFFTAIDGSRITLNDFAGRVVVVQTMSTLCLPCQDQSGDLRIATQKLDEFGNATNVVFLNLSVDPLDTLDDLQQYQSQFGMESTPTITWITGLASQDLLRDIRDAFGERYIDPGAGELFFVDPFGYGQISDVGFMVSDRLRDVVINLLTTEPEVINTSAQQATEEAVPLPGADPEALATEES